MPIDDKYLPKYEYAYVYVDDYYLYPMPVEEKEKDETRGVVEIDLGNGKAEIVQE